MYSVNLFEPHSKKVISQNKTLEKKSFLLHIKILILFSSSFLENL